MVDRTKYDAVLAPSLTTVVSVLKMAPPEAVTLLNTQVISVAKCTALFWTSQLCRNKPPPSYHHPVPVVASTYTASTLVAPGPNWTPGTLSSRKEKDVYPAW